MRSEERKLVSVVIVAYRSADTIAETLDSIYNQTYPNIELIISDDASPDNTVEVAQAWVDAHKERFVNCVVLTHEKNQGVSGNLNDGIRAATGWYIKDFAADDLLLPEYLETHVAYLEENGLDSVFSDVQAFQTRNGEKEFISYPGPAGPEFFDAPAEVQYRMLLQGNRLYSPTFLATRALYEKNGLYDERFPLMEDYPYYLKLAKQGSKLNYLDVKQVAYRMGEASISNGVDSRVLSPYYHKAMKAFFYGERIHGLWKMRDFKYLLKTMWELFFGDCILAFGNNRKSALVRFCEYMKDTKFMRKQEDQ